MSKQIRFEVGCFHFGVKKIPPFKFKGEDYIQELNKSLSSIPNIKKIKITCTDIQFKNTEIEITTKPPPISDGPDYFPQPEFLTIEFQIHIPYKNQKDIYTKLERLGMRRPKKATEDFYVTIDYSYYFPVTFIELTNFSNEFFYHDAVFIVREFLTEKFNDNISEYIQFEDIGPSPFHANFFIVEKKDMKLDDNFIITKIDASEPIKEVIFNFNKEFLEDKGGIEEIKKYIFWLIINELGFFYKLIQIFKLHEKKWDDVQNVLDELISLQKEKGFKNYFKKMFFSSSKLNQLFLNIIEFESDLLSDHNYIRYNYDDTYDDLNKGYLKPFIDAEVKNVEEAKFATNQAREIFSLMENHRIKSTELLIVLFAALIGVIGVIIGVILSLML